MGLKKIVALEKSLRDNKVQIARLTTISTTEGKKELRLFLMLRTQIKDQLLEAYRKEISERITHGKHDEVLGDDSNSVRED